MKYLAVISVILGLDLGMKNYIEKNVEDGEVREKPGRLLIIRKHHNRGAFLNAGQHRQRMVAVLSLLMTLILTIFFFLTLGTAGKGILKWGLTLLLGGAYSNTYDRLKRRYVVDYLTFQVGWKPLGRVVFNLSDFAIMIGAMLAVLGASRDEG